MTHSPATPRTFSNPLLASGPDPWVICHDGFYYYMHSIDTNLTIWKTTDLTQLARAERKIVWTAPETGPCSRNIWSPELHFINGVWYIYFSADDERGINERQRMFVLVNETADPFSDHWRLAGELRLPDDKWAIDGTAFTYRGQLYFTWSGWAGDDNTRQDIYLCRLKDPLTADGERVILSEPVLDWERYNYDPDPENPRNHIVINEGPAPLLHGDRLFLIYSANGCWTDQYCLGMLTAPTDTDLMTPGCWIKHPRPVFQTSVENQVYAPGHNSFFRTADGSHWLFYHANPRPGLGCGNERSPRLQPVHWQPDGTPYFGTPVAEGVPITWRQ